MSDMAIQQMLAANPQILAMMQQQKGPNPFQAAVAQNPAMTSPLAQIAPQQQPQRPPMASSPGYVDNNPLSREQQQAQVTLANGPPTQQPLAFAQPMAGPAVNTPQAQAMVPDMMNRTAGPGVSGAIGVMGAPPPGTQTAQPQQTFPTVPIQPQQPLPQTGLAGSENALQGGAQAALAALTEGLGASRSSISSGGSTQAMQAGGAQAAQYLDPYAKQGSQALTLQAALSGAAGADAQREAYANYSASPGQQFLQEQSERALLRNQAALGGLGGGRVRQELQRQSIGLAQQGFSDDFNRLGQVTGAGLTAAGQQAGIQGQLTAQEMQNANQRSIAESQMAANAAQQAASILYGTGNTVAGGRYNAGNDLARAISGTTSALANLSNDQGANIGNTIGATGGNLANILSGAGQAQATSQQNLATLLANINSGQGTQTASLPGIPGVQQNPGILSNVGNFLSGVGTLLPQERT